MKGIEYMRGGVVAGMGTNGRWWHQESNRRARRGGGANDCDGMSCAWGGEGVGGGKGWKSEKGREGWGGVLPACTCECDPVKWAPCVTECMLHHVVWRGCGVVILCTVVIFHSSPPPFLGSESPFLSFLEFWNAPFDTWSHPPLLPPLLPPTCLVSSNSLLSFFLYFSFWWGEWWWLGYKSPSLPCLCLLFVCLFHSHWHLPFLPITLDQSTGRPKEPRDRFTCYTHPSITTFSSFLSCLFVLFIHILSKYIQFVGARRRIDQRMLQIRSLWRMWINQRKPFPPKMNWFYVLKGL